MTARSCELMMGVVINLKRSETLLYKLKHLELMFVRTLGWSHRLTFYIKSKQQRDQRNLIIFRTFRNGIMRHTHSSLCTVKITYSTYLVNIPEPVQYVIYALALSSILCKTKHPVGFAVGT